MVATVTPLICLGSAATSIVIVEANRLAFCGVLAVQFSGKVIPPLPFLSDLPFPLPSLPLPSSLCHRALDVGLKVQEEVEEEVRPL